LFNQTAVLYFGNISSHVMSSNLYLIRSQFWHIKFWWLVVKHVS